jgi:LTXXQ motif family protein
MTPKFILALSLAAFAFPVSLWAEDAHHPQPTEKVIPETPPVPTEASSMGMMGMMPDMMRTMQEMGDPTRHLEGRIAFLHAELAITADQDTVWSAFADALRKNAAALKSASSGEHGHDPESGVVGALIVKQHRLERQLEGLVAINAALGPLAAKLSEGQRGILDELLPHVIGMMAMGGMMPMAGMAPSMPAEATAPAP